MNKDLIISIDDFENELSSKFTGRSKTAKNNVVINDENMIYYTYQDTTPKQFSDNEKKSLLEAVKNISLNSTQNRPCDIDWGNISKVCPNRQPIECLMQYRNNLDPSINKNKWTRNEEFTLVDLVKKYKERYWILIAEELNTGTFHLF